MRNDVEILDKSFVHFLLLNGYSQANPGLMYGKLGISLSLFEASRLCHDEMAEGYAYDLLSEVLASSTIDYSFDNGKAGIAWAILYLINEQYIDADYRELYTSEHDSLIEFLKKTERIDVSQSIHCLCFLLMAESYIAPKDFAEIWNKLSDIIVESYAQEVKDGFDDFYSNSVRIIGLYNLYKNKRPSLKPLVEAIVRAYCKIQEDGYICNCLAFGVELLAYGMECEKSDTISLADSVIHTYFSNMLIEILDYKTSVDILYYIRRLAGLRDKEEYSAIEYKVKALLQDKGSHLFYWADRQTLSELKRGITRFVWLESSEVEEWSPEKHIIMLQ